MVVWNTGAAAMRFRAKNKSEPPVDHKLVHKLHDAWARANGYKPQAASRKLQARKSLTPTKSLI